MDREHVATTRDPGDAEAVALEGQREARCDSRADHSSARPYGRPLSSKDPREHWQRYERSLAVYRTALTVSRRARSEHQEATGKSSVRSSGTGRMADPQCAARVADMHRFCRSHKPLSARAYLSWDSDSSAAEEPESNIDNPERRSARFRAPCVVDPAHRRRCVYAGDPWAEKPRFLGIQVFAQPPVCRNGRLVTVGRSAAATDASYGEHVVPDPADIRDSSRALEKIFVSDRQTTLTGRARIWSRLARNEGLLRRFGWPRCSA